MSSLLGKPLLAASSKLIQQYALVMARYHKLGHSYESKVLGGEATSYIIESRIEKNLAELCQELCRQTEILNLQEIDLINTVADYIHTTFYEQKTLQILRTHIHGDFRLCHVLYTSEKLSGIIDIDESTYAERLIDVCYGVTSSPNPAGGTFFSIEQIQQFLADYNQEFPFTPSERKIIKSMLLYVLLEQLDELSEFYENGESSATLSDIQLTKNVLAHIFEIEEANLIAA